MAIYRVMDAANAELLIIQNLMSNQGTFVETDELWFYTNAIAYKVEPCIGGYKIENYNRFQKKWETTAWEATVDQVVRTLHLFQPFLSSGEIPPIWGNVFNALPVTTLDPLLASFNTFMDSQGVAVSNTMLIFYGDCSARAYCFAYRVKNCHQKLCVDRNVRIATDIFEGWQPLVSSGDVAHASAAINEGAPFLDQQAASQVWGNLPLCQNTINPQVGW